MKLKKVKFFILAFLLVFLLPKQNVVLAEEKSKTTSYDMNITFNEEKKSLNVNESVEFTNTYNHELDNLVFHLYPDSYKSIDKMPLFSNGLRDKALEKEEIGDIDIKKVLVNNKEVKFSQEKQILKFSLETPLKENDTIEISITFTLKIPKGYGRLGYNNEVYYLSNWYPILSMYNASSNSWDENEFHPVGESNYSNASNYNVTLNTNKNMVIASTGVISSEETKGNVKSTKIKAENVRDFTFMMSEKFKVLSKKVNDIKVNSFYISDQDEKLSTKIEAQRMLDFGADSIDFFSKTFGKYPYPEFDIVETYLSGGAMEYPQIIQMGKYPNYTNNNDSKHFYLDWNKEAVVHETAHQWWYASVGNNEFKEPFLDESLTVYSTALYFEKKEGKYSENAIANTIRDHYYYLDKSYSFDTSVDKFENQGIYTETIYINAPIVFEDLRTQVGEKTFLKIMQTYFKNYLYKNASIEGFLKVIKDVSGENTANNIKKAITSKDYNPEKLQLTEEEHNIINKNRLISQLTLQEKSSGITIGSFLLRTLKGEKILLVKPTNLTKEEKPDVEKLISSIIDVFKVNYGITLNVKEDRALTNNDIKNYNLMLLGNPKNNEYIRKNTDKMPICITPKGIITDNLILKDNQSTGLFILDSSKDGGKLNIVLFWYNMKPYFYYIQNYNTFQYVIHSKNGTSISGTSEYNHSYE
ncbi:M1 family metallopeptidase [Haloimpatiens sp. FM7315]|uniref:M1 family metallopeptidase n=1 Tax=Haloimpatiens sp. FM7315 TaxID=3298609 RepID=UPI00370C2A76